MKYNSISAWFTEAHKLFFVSGTLWRVCGNFYILHKEYWSSQSGQRMWERMYENWAYGHYVLISEEVTLISRLDEIHHGCFWPEYVEICWNLI